MKNSISKDEFRITFDYFRITKQFFHVYMQFMTKYHDYLSNFKHEYFMIVDFKHIYSIVEIYSNDQEFFVFTISNLK